MFVFNLVAGLEVLVAAIPAGLTYAVLHYALGLETATWWATIVGAACIVPMDLLVRLTHVSGSDGDEEGEEATPGMGVSAFFLPSGGGHLVFMPMYVMSTLAVIGLATGFFKG